MQLALIALIANALLLIGCTRSPDLPDVFHRADYANPPGRNLDYASRAPVVVLGTVTQAVAVGKPKAAREDPRLLIQLTQISLQPEIVLRGKLTASGLKFYYYTFSAQNKQDLGTHHYLPILGERRVFFLEEVQGVYRSVGDVTDYTLAVRSGFHDRSFCEAEPSGCCLAKLLLQLGHGYDPKSFAQGLHYAVYASKLLCSPAATLRLLDNLSSVSDETIASR